jgi:DNA-binding protein Fis
MVNHEDIGVPGSEANVATGTKRDDAATLNGEPLPSLHDVEQRYIAHVLNVAHGNQRRAARILGISRWSLSRRLRKYGLPPRSAA